MLFLGGCNFKTTSSTKLSKNGLKPITLEFWTLQMGTFADVLTPMIAKYEQDHPGIHIHWVDLPFSEGPKKTLAAMLSPHVPDVVNLNPDFAAILAQRQAIWNINTLIREKDRLSYLPAVWQAVSLSKKTGSDGSFCLGVPWYVSTRVTLYNRRILKESGIEQPARTWEELFEQIRTIHRINNTAYGLMPTLAENGSFLKELKKADVPLWGNDGQAIFATEKGIKFLSQWVSLYQSKTIPAESLSEGQRAAVDQYQSGRLAYLLSGANFLKIIQENAPSIYRETDVAPQFPTKNQNIDFSTMILTLPKHGAHPGEALDFALYITNAKNQLALSKKAPVLPSVKAALSDPYFQAKSSKENSLQSVDLIEKARIISASQLLRATGGSAPFPEQRDINTQIDYTVQLALLQKKNAKQALTEAQTRINEIRNRH